MKGHVKLNMGITFSIPLQLHCNSSAIVKRCRLSVTAVGPSYAL